MTYCLDKNSDFIRQILRVRGLLGLNLLLSVRRNVMPNLVWRLSTCSEEGVVEACTRDDCDGPGVGDLASSCPNLLALTQDLLSKVRKPQREMNLGDEVFDDKCIVFFFFFPNQSSN